MTISFLNLFFSFYHSNSHYLELQSSYYHFVSLVLLWHQKDRRIDDAGKCLVFMLYIITCKDMMKLFRKGLLSAPRFSNQQTWNNHIDYIDIFYFTNQKFTGTYILSQSNLQVYIFRELRHFIKRPIGWQPNNKEHNQSSEVQDFRIETHRTA